MQVAFEQIFGQGLWIIIGSLVAFLIGQVTDVVVAFPEIDLLLVGVHLHKAVMIF